jgi:misacylated tRNA(Ala) deacylase
LTKLLYQYDSYLKEFDAIITKVSGDKIFLDQTAFHPRPSGGLDADTGYLVIPDKSLRIRVVDTFLENDDVAHKVERPIDVKEGTKVRGLIDWERRYRMMRLHTASHIIAAVLYERYGAKVTGGHITPEAARDDFDLSNVNNWKEALEEAVNEANRIASKCIEVKVYWLKREEALKIPGIVKLAEKTPPSVEVVRVVEIPGVDIQLDGAPHVKNTCEIGKIKILKIESKGKRRKRLYYTLEEKS